MPIPWYDPALYGWIPGTLFGVALGILGAFVGHSRGKLNRLTAKLVLGTAVVSVTFLLGGVVALAMNQPRGVWYSLLHPGVVGLSAFGVILAVVKRV